MRARWNGFTLLACLAACGDNRSAGIDGALPRGTFEIVGHSDLGARGMSSALAVAGDTVYVGSRIDTAGIAIVDIADPAHPAVVGTIGPPSAGKSSRELRVVPDLDLLIVLNLACSPDLHGCAAGGQGENLRLYDIRDRRAPVELATYSITTSILRQRSPHEFYVHVDGARVLVFLAAPSGSPQLEVIDVSTPSAPVRFAAWDPRDAGLRPNASGDDILHSVGVSEDGRVAYLSHQQSGLLLADVSALPAVSLLTPPENAVTWEPVTSMGPHSAVPVPGKQLLVVSEEIYPMPFSTGCPWGHLRMVDIADPAAPVIVGEYKLAENDPSICAMPHERVAYTAHNATVTADLALVTWYAGGLQAVDISDPAHPRQLAELRPTPVPSVAVEDPGLGGSQVEMWSYPVIQDGLIYVVDVRNGLYVLRYDGPYAEQIAGERFREGNSNL